MKRTLLPAIALTVALPAFAGSDTETYTNVSETNAPLMMDENWNAGELAEFDAPMIERDGWSLATDASMTTEELTGLRVYDANDEWIGEIDNVIVNASGEIEGAVLGVGGFIGIMEKDVLVSFDSLTIKEEIDGDEMRVYASMTQEELENLPAYES